MKTKTALLAVILLILITAVNSPAILGDTIPCRYEISRGDDPESMMILIEWGNLERPRLYMVQTTCGSLTNWVNCLAVNHPESDKFQLGLESHMIETRCGPFFWRMIDNTPPAIDPQPRDPWLLWLPN